MITDKICFVNMKVRKKSGQRIFIFLTAKELFIYTFTNH